MKLCSIPSRDSLPFKWFFFALLHVMSAMAYSPHSTTAVLLGNLLIDPVVNVGSSSSNSCMPANCTALCQPGCSKEQVCTLRTMVDCGVCPASKCVDRSMLGVPPEASGTPEAVNQKSSDEFEANGAFIGGLVGGLIGVGLLIATIGCAFVKYRRKKNRLPEALQGNLIACRELHGHMAKVPKVENPMSQDGASPYPTLPTASTYQTQTAAHARSDHGMQSKSSSPVPTVTMPVSSQPNNARHSATRNSTYRDSRYSNNEYHSCRTGSRLSGSVADSEDSWRGSYASTINQPQSTPAQAIQIIRTRPQLMRVSSTAVGSSGSIRTFFSSSDNISRSSQIRSLQVQTKRDEEPNHAVVHAYSRPSVDATAHNFESSLDDPFHDRYSRHADSVTSLSEALSSFTIIPAVSGQHPNPGSDLPSITPNTQNK
ncbi:uncharacterized protein BYT42DRAFT_601455 [Radiomyces spectabilis]|uniref:uncharacterized protein n=1 Tax=Radiomyces spectabilis TaxID=64574 RepID=UPI0022211532|nr:uncharacterized protein BYT42DRAFT_601455 [Radiomyces spectabilis]KAI8393895.1 hypothetical protein BYT42DRAFT_601455 [Radiomyces spectabilis]